MRVHHEHPAVKQGIATAHVVLRTERNSERVVQTRYAEDVILMFGRRSESFGALLREILKFVSGMGELRLYQNDSTSEILEQRAVPSTSYVRRTRASPTAP